jgi:hypothetical protein
MVRAQAVYHVLAILRRFSQLRRRPFLLRLDPHLGREERDAQVVLLVRAAYSRTPTQALTADRFWPTINTTHTDDLIFWTNGGPGCSSLEGFLQENGPIREHFHLMWCCSPS